MFKLKYFNLKRGFLIAGCWFWFSSVAQANWSPLENVLSAKEVYVTTVTRSPENNNNVAFRIEETLRGKPIPFIRLHQYAGNKYPVGAYSLLISSGQGSKDLVWDYADNRCGWITISISHEDGKPFVLSLTDWIKEINLDMASDGTKGLTLDHLRRLLQQKPKS
jgi:hypothetical protein